MICQWCDTDRATIKVARNDDSHELNVCDECADMIGTLLVELAHRIDGAALAEWIDTHKVDVIEPAS